MFYYVVKTTHDNENIITNAFPEEVENDPQAYLKYYDIFQDKNDYIKDEIKQKNNLEELIESFSFYSVIFYTNLNTSNSDSDSSESEFESESQKTNIEYLKTNRCHISNIYSFFDDIMKNKNDNDSLNNQSWNPRIFNTISIPPRSRLYLFQHPDYKGRMYTFDNESNAHKVYELEITFDDNISSLKWFTKYPIKDKYVIDENEKLYRPFQIGDSYDLDEKNEEYHPDLHLPLYKMRADPHHKNAINKWHNR